MKKLNPLFSIILLLFILPNFCLAQDLRITEDATGKYNYQVTKDCPNLDSKEIYKRLKNWGKIKYHNYRRLEEDENDESKGLIFKGRFENAKGVKVHYTLIVEVKEHKYRATTTNFLYQPATPGKTPIEEMKAFRNTALRMAEKNVETLLADLDANIKNEGALSKEW